MPRQRRRRRGAPRPGDGAPVPAGPDAGQVGPVDLAVVGCQGAVTVRIPGGESPGEVLVRVRGTNELFIAYIDEALNVGNRVFVHRSRGGRAVDVILIFTEPE